MISSQPSAVSAPSRERSRPPGSVALVRGYLDDFITCLTVCFDCGYTVVMHGKFSISPSI